MARTFVLSSTASDLGGGADFSLLLADATETASSQSVGVANGATETSYAFTDLGVPGTDGTSTGTFTVEVNVLTGHASIFLSVRLDQVTAAGSVAASSAVSAEQSLSSTGVKTFTFVDPALGSWISGRRLRVAYLFRSSQAMGGAASVSIERGTTDTEVATPFAAPVTTVNGQAVGAFGGTFTAAGVVTAPPVTGAASASLGGTFAASGIDRALGTAAASLGFTGSAAGVAGSPTVTGSGQASLGGTFTAAGIDRTLGQATASLGGTFTAAGIDRAIGQALASLGFTASASGVTGSPPVTGSGQASFGGTFTAAGIDRALGIAVAGFTFTTTASGQPRTRGAGLALFAVSTTASGRVRHPGIALASLSFLATGSGFAGQLIIGTEPSLTLTDPDPRVGIADTHPRAGIADPDPRVGITDTHPRATITEESAHADLSG